MRTGTGGSHSINSNNVTYQEYGFRKEDYRTLSVLRRQRGEDMQGLSLRNNTGEHPSCVLNINAIIGNRKMNDGEIAEFLEKRRILLDGFSTKEGKTFPTVLELADDGAVNMQSVIGRCPHCGGEVRVGTRAFNCSNYSNQEKPCSFAIWRNIGGHQLTLEEAKELCEKNITSSELEMYREDGSIYRKRLGLAPDKLQIVKI